MTLYRFTSISQLPPRRFTHKELLHFGCRSPEHGVGIGLDHLNLFAVLRREYEELGAIGKREGAYTAFVRCRQTLEGVRPPRDRGAGKSG